MISYSILFYFIVIFILINILIQYRKCIKSSTREHFSAITSESIANLYGVYNKNNLIVKDLIVDDNINIDGDIIGNGNVDVIGDMTINKNANINGDVVLNNTLTTKGISQFNNNVTIKDDKTLTSKNINTCVIKSNQKGDAGIKINANLHSYKNTTVEGDVIMKGDFIFNNDQIKKHKVTLSNIPVLGWKDHDIKSRCCF